MRKLMKTQKKNIYDNEEYLDKNINWHQEDSPYKSSFVKRIIEKNNLTFHTCLDLGCGAGLVTECLAREFPEKNFIGNDFSADAKRFWKKRMQLSNLSFSNNDLFSSKEIYDLVVCLDVFEHIEDYYSFLRKIRNFGENFIFNVPLDMNVMKVLTNGIQYTREEVGHLHYFNEYTALETLKDCGYEIVDNFLSTSFLSIPPRNKKQLAVLPFRLLTLCFGKSFASRLFGGQSLVILAK